MRIKNITLLIVMIATGASAWSAPYIGYLYPAGGQRGSVVRVHLGGQRLGNVKSVVITGDGIQGNFVSFEGAEGPLNSRQREYLREEIQELKKLKTAPVAVPAAPAVPDPAGPEKPKIALPDFPDLRELEQKTPQELDALLVKYVYKQKLTKPPLAEDVILEVTIAPDATPGDRELRVITPGGISNPMLFQVDRLPELREKERETENALDPPPAEAPVILNGQIMPGEVDRFSLNLKANQHLYIAAQARRLVPFIADAVPGWCQTVIALIDANGKELAFVDDNFCEPDPVMFVQVPRDGMYTLLIRDSIYRGREDFVYRVTVREQTPDDNLSPFIPLPREPVEGNPQLPVVESRMPASKEIEPNDNIVAAQLINLPLLIDGRIDQPGDADLYQFTGKAGDTVIAEIYARRLGSPIDSLLRLYDSAGKVVAWNDDYTGGELGLQAHRADSCLAVKLPADGLYTVQVSEAQRHGGEAYNYALRVSPPQPDFSLRATPSAINVPVGGTTTVTVYAIRRDGWDGNIEIAMVDAPDGFTLTKTRIPADQNSVAITLQAPRKPTDQPITLTFVGLARLNEQTVIRPVIPADRLMQAFAYYHLVPAQQLQVMVFGQ